MPRKGGERVRLAIEADKTEAARLIKRAAGPIVPGETTKARITRTIPLLGWDRSRIRDVWYGDAARIDAHEMDQLRNTTKVQIIEFSPDIPSEDSDSG